MELIWKHPENVFGFNEMGGLKWNPDDLLNRNQSADYPLWEIRAPQGGMPNEKDIIKSI